MSLFSWRWQHQGLAWIGLRPTVSWAGLIDAADAGARRAANVLDEDVRSPFQTEETPPGDVGRLQPGEVLPSDAESRNCPGNVFQTVVLGPTPAVLDDMAARFKSNELQARFLHMVNDNVVSILDGPPGTGKTQALLPLLVAWAMWAPPGFTVVVTAGSNAALDNIMWRLIEGITTHGIELDVKRLVRFARGEQIKDPRVYPYTPDGVFQSRFFRPPDREDGKALLDIKRELVGDARIIFVTLEKAPQALGIKGAPKPCLVVQEESSQCTEGMSYVALLDGVASGARIVLAGDHRQLPPLSTARLPRRRGTGCRFIRGLRTTCQSTPVSSTLWLSISGHTPASCSCTTNSTTTGNWSARLIRHRGPHYETSQLNKCGNGQPTFLMTFSTQTTEASMRMWQQVGNRTEFTGSPYYTSTATKCRQRKEARPTCMKQVRWGSCSSGSLRNVLSRA